MKEITFLAVAVVIATCLVYICLNGIDIRTTNAVAVDINIHGDIQMRTVHAVQQVKPGAKVAGFAGCMA